MSDYDDLVLRAMTKFVEDVVAGACARGVPPRHPELLKTITDIAPQIEARMRGLSAEQLGEYAATRH